MSRRLVLAFCALTISAIAATSTTWETSGFNDFVKGRLSGVSLTAEGFLEPGPAVSLNLALNQPVLWDVAAASNGTLYAATGHAGKVFQISSAGKLSLVWVAEQPEVFALAVDSKNNLYAGSSPNGSVYRINHGTATKVWQSPAKYIWAIQAAPDGSLYIATGEPGRIYHVASDGEAKLYYDTGQSNVTSLKLAPNGHLYAGTDPNGLLYDIWGHEQGTILFDSTLPEIRSIAIDQSGTVYAAAMGGGLSTRSSTGTTATSSTNTAVLSTSPTTVTVTAAKQNGIKTGDEPSTTTQSTSSTGTAVSTGSTTTSTPGTTVTEVSGVEKSAIYRIRPDRIIDTVYTSKEQNVYDLLLDNDVLLFSTDQRGRVYRWDKGKLTLLSEPGDGTTTRLRKLGSRLYAALSNPARLFAFDSASSDSGSYESQVHDVNTVAHWGHLRWRGIGSGVLIRTRTGNATRPDATWSAWAAPANGPEGMLIQSPPARYIQWRAEWPAHSTARVDAVDIPYLAQNTPPVIRSITVSSILSTNAAKVNSTTASTSSAYSVTVTETGEAPTASSTTTAVQTASRLQTTQTQISWQADDPDNDKLIYSVYFRAEGEQGWQLIRNRMFENTLLLDPDVLADGRYFFRVVASDAPSNASQFAHQTELVSTPVLIDNTPPAVSIGPVKRKSDALDIDISATDQTSPLRQCEFSLDTGVWQPIEAVDGITDSPQERFHLHLDKVHPGEHLLVFRVYDAANNAGLAKVILH